MKPKPQPVEADSKGSQGWRERFHDKFNGIYYGKDDDGYPDYPSEVLMDDIRAFIESELSLQRSKILEEVRGMSLPETCDEIEATGTCGHAHGFESDYNRAIHDLLECLSKPTE